jgi:hypothetical protein
MSPSSAIARHIGARHGRDFLRMLGAELGRVAHLQQSDKDVRISHALAREIAEGLRVEADALDRFTEESNGETIEGRARGAAGGNVRGTGAQLSGTG